MNIGNRKLTKIIPLYFPAKAWEILLLVWMVVGICVSLHGQPDNDDCLQAIHLEEVADWCSAVNAYSNLGASASMETPADCFTNTEADIWFTFTLQAPGLSVAVLGDAASGSLEGPEIALYEGSCDELEEVACRAGQPTSGARSLQADGLQPGVRHYLRLRSHKPGTFQLCINNFSPPTSPSSDCPEASVLCNKDPFVVEKVYGPGAVASEANDASCLNGFGANVESHSSWFVWVAGSDGPLTFTLSPVNPPDDIDFVVYEFPNGPGNCQDKIPLRCMASSCDGPTGLNLSSTDLSEPPNCNDPSQDNFLAALQMEAGKTYGLMINNFSSTGLGFKVEFGGSGTIVGPEPRITRDKEGSLCLGDTIVLEDASSFGGGQIVGWDWSFGPDASLPAAQAAGPHQLSYSRTGKKLVWLRLLTSLGCMVNVLEEVEVQCCGNSLLVDAGEAIEARLGESVQLQATSPVSGLSYSWSPQLGLSCTDCPNPELLPLESSWYTVRVEEANGCTAEDSVRVTLSKERPVFLPDAFSPNDDGRNDIFTAFPGPAVSQLPSFRVFDRWGTLVFEKENLSPDNPVVGWDGRIQNQPAPLGVYTYVVVVEYINGQRSALSGSVLLVR